LTERSSAAVWLASWRGAGIDVRSWWFRWVAYFSAGVVSSSDLYRAWARLASERCGVAPEPSEELYNAHSAWVKSLVPADRLLVFRHDMGWEPLCKFLGRELEVDPGVGGCQTVRGQNVPFPRNNERRYLRFYKRMAVLCGLVVWIAIALLIWSTYDLLRRRVVRDGHVDVFKLYLSVMLAYLPELLASGQRVLKSAGGMSAELSYNIQGPFVCD
jgi:hypothetical protein